MKHGDFQKHYDGDIRDLAVVVAYDPGQTTGVAVLGVKPTWFTSPESFADVGVGLAHVEYAQIDCGSRSAELGATAALGHAGLNMAGEIAGVDLMAGMLRFYHIPAIVMEDFILDFNQATTARHTLVPVRIMAAFCYAISGRNLPLFIQNRALAKTTCSDVRLKAWKMYDSHSGPHARDAIRHAYYFLRTCQGNTVAAQEKRHLAWPHLFQSIEMKVATGIYRDAVKRIGEIIPGLG